MKKGLLSLVVVCEVALGDVEDVPANSIHEGWYLAAAINYQHTTCKITESDSLGLWNTVFKTDSVKQGFGLMGGGIIGGCGTLVNGSCYIGAEVIFDISKNSEHGYVIENNSLTSLAGQRFTVRVGTKVKGFVPGGAVRLGYLATSIDTLFYLTAGASYVQTEVKGTSEGSNVPPEELGTMKKKRLVPSVGIGIEKGICNHFNVRLEGSWRFSSTKKEISKDTLQQIGNISWEYKSQSDGYVIRLIFSRVF